MGTQLSGVNRDLMGPGNVVLKDNYLQEVIVDGIAIGNHPKVLAVQQRQQRRPYAHFGQFETQPAPVMANST